MRDSKIFSLIATRIDSYSDKMTFNSDEELKNRDQKTDFKIKTIFGEPEEKSLKPDQHGVYNIDDYKPPK